MWVRTEIQMVIANLQPAVGPDGESLITKEVSWIWTQVSGLQDNRGPG